MVTGWELPSYETGRQVRAAPLFAREEVEGAHFVQTPHGYERAAYFHHYEDGYLSPGNVGIRPTVCWVLRIREKD